MSVFSASGSDGTRTLAAILGKGVWRLGRGAALGVAITLYTLPVDFCWVSESDGSCVSARPLASILVALLAAMGVGGELYEATADRGAGVAGRVRASVSPREGAGNE
jgi:hypothetical protein